MTHEHKTPERVVIESPWRGNRRRNLAYLLACMKDSFERGEAPFASPALYAATGALNDDVDAERQIGILAGTAWGECAKSVAVYVYLGLTEGMKVGIAHYAERGIQATFRSIPGWTWPPPK